MFVRIYDLPESSNLSPMILNLNHVISVDTEEAWEGGYHPVLLLSDKTSIVVDFISQKSRVEALCAWNSYTFENRMQHIP
jgi:hypothetical protein